MRAARSVRYDASELGDNCGPDALYCGYACVDREFDVVAVAAGSIRTILAGRIEELGDLVTTNVARQILDSRDRVQRGWSRSECGPVRRTGFIWWPIRW